ncbi:MAG: N-6 DNA methylase, partial [Promethearchaeota archaeon]
MEKSHKRKYGSHLTSTDIFQEYILPDIKPILKDYIWIDLYAGEGNLILPILDVIPIEEREEFFRGHIFLFDIQSTMVEKCIENAKSLGISKNTIKKNIRLRDNLESFPQFLKKEKLPIFHITNPPYLYLGYIRKHIETKSFLKHFANQNIGYQDLYQIAMINDLRNDIENLIYIIPSNFLFGAAVSNKFRLDFLNFYNIEKMIIFETKIFEDTGTNICIGFFKRKPIPRLKNIEFEGIKIKKKNKRIEKRYILKPEFKYRAGSEFEEFLEEYHTQEALKVKYYLLKKEILANQGDKKIRVIDANNYHSNEYKRLELQINGKLKNEIVSNILYLRTVDTGSYNGRVGLGVITEDFKVDGIYVSGNTYRTHPIHIFFEPNIPFHEQKLLKDYFNFILEFYREKLDSEFLTTYKYSNAEYTRKYLGLTQARKLIQT